MAFQWKGVFPALTTPFNSTDELDLEMFEKNLEAQLLAGVHGLIVGGSLGEASTITQEEKAQLVKTSIHKVKGKIPVILNIAEASTREAIHQTKLAAAWGADGLMLLPPMRYRSATSETLAYFKSIAASTDLPIMIYNNPIDYGIEVTPDMFEELAKVESIQAVKESTRDVTNITRMRNRFGERFQLLCGVDTLAMEELCMGADGWVAGLVDAFPEETVIIYELIRQGRFEEAKKIYSWFLPLLELDIHPKLVQYIKLAGSVTGLGSEYVRAPRLKLEGEEREKILRIINDAIACRPVLPGLSKTERKAVSLGISSL